MDPDAASKIATPEPIAVGVWIASLQQMAAAYALPTPEQTASMIWIVQPGKSVRLINVHLLSPMHRKVRTVAAVMIPTVKVGRVVISTAPAAAVADATLDLVITNVLMVKGAWSMKWAMACAAKTVTWEPAQWEMVVRVRMTASTASALMVAARRGAVTTAGVLPNTAVTCRSVSRVFAPTILIMRLVVNQG